LPLPTDAGPTHRHGLIKRFEQRKVIDLSSLGKTLTCCFNIQRPIGDVVVNAKPRLTSRVFMPAWLSLAAILLACAGCQTFTLSDEDFQKQQRGGVADPHVGAAVSVAGTAAYMGAVVGAAVAGVR